MREWHPEYFLQRCPKHIKAQMTTVQVQPGEYLLQLGDISRYVYVMLEGEFKVFHAMENGTDVYPYVGLYNKEFVGDVEAVMGQDAYIGSNVQAKTRCVAVKMPREAFVEWLYTDMELNRYVMGRYAYWIHLQSEYGSTQASLSMRARMARLIDELLLQHPEREIVSKALLCGVLATSMRSANRILKQMKEEGMIMVVGDDVRVLDEDALRSAEYDR